MKYRYPEGRQGEQTLRMMLRAIAKQLKRGNLSAKDTIKLLTHEERLSEQLRLLTVAKLQSQLKAAEKAENDGRNVGESVR